MVARCKTAPALPATPPPIRSYQQDLLRCLMDKSANKTASVEEDTVARPEIRRLNRRDKKARGWALPDLVAYATKSSRTLVAGGKELYDTTPQFS